MKVCVRQAFVPFSTTFEGMLTWMYLDVKGLVTIGMGNLIDPIIPPTLKFVDKQGMPASWDTVLAEYKVVKTLQAYKMKGGYYYRNLTSLRATQESILELIGGELDVFEHHLRGHFPDWDTFPADGQLAILSIAWACGANFPLTWPKFTDAVNRGAWGEAANESHIDTTGNPGVRPRNSANRSLCLNAGLTVTPEQLVYHV